MAIRVTGYTARGLDVWHDELGHGGALVWAALAFAPRPDGTPNRDGIVLACPVAGCDSTSVHPIGGGCDPAGVQELAVRLYTRLKIGGAQDRAAALALVRARIATTDGDARWRLGE